MNSFKALFNRKYGELKVEAGQISFINAEENIQIKIPFHDLETEVISENNDQILLSSRSQGITISTYDLEVSNALVKQGSGGVGSLRSKLYKTQKLKFVTIFFIVFTPLFFLLILPLSIKFIPVKYYEDYVSISSLKVLGEPALASFNAKSTAVSFKIQDLAQKIINATNSKSKIVHLPPLKDGDMTRRCPDNTKMRVLLGRDLISIDEGIKKLLDSPQFQIKY